MQVSGYRECISYLPATLSYILYQYHVADTVNCELATFLGGDSLLRSVPYHSLHHRLHAFSNFVDVELRFAPHHVLYVTIFFT